MKKLIVTLFLLQTSICSFSQLVIQMKREGGVSIVPCKVNGLNLSFIFDTGASDVTISLTEASFMLKNGYLKKEDIIGSEKYLDARGNISEGITINLREIEIEGLKLYNVKASIVKSMEAPLLLGQSALSKLGTIYLDLDKNQLTIVSASKYSNTGIKKSDDALVNSNVYKNAFLLLAKTITTSTSDKNTISKYFSLNTSELLDEDSLWYLPFETYKFLNASSYYYTFCDSKKYKNKDIESKENYSLSEVLNNLKSFSRINDIDWSSLDTTNITIKPYSDDEIIFSFNCSNNSYCFVSTIVETFSDSTKGIKINLPYRFDSKSFFEFRNAIYKKFLQEINYISGSNDQNIQLSYFYENLANNFENDYDALPLSDKQKFSSVYFEPAYWCERAANLRRSLGDDEQNILRQMSLFTKAISLYEKNLYPFTKKNYDYLYLYSNRGECKYKMGDYAGAYKDYKKAIDIYERNRGAKGFLKHSITDIYYDFSNICYFIKKYDECKSSIDKGINTYFTGLESYNPTWYKLYTLRGYLYFSFTKTNNKHAKIGHELENSATKMLLTSYSSTVTNKLIL